MNYFTKEQLEDITNSILSNPVVETLKELYDKYSSNGETNKELEITQVNNLENRGMQESNQESVVVEEASSIPAINNTSEVPMPNVESTTEVASASQENTVNIPIFGGDNNVVNTHADSVVSPIPSVIETPATSAIPNVVETPSVNPLPSTPAVENTPTNSIPNFINNVPETPVQAPTFEVPSFSMPEVSMPTANNNLNSQNLNINSNPFNSPVFGGNLWETPTNGVNNLMQTTDNFNKPEETKVEPVKQEVSVPFFGGPAEAVNNPIPVQEKPQNYGPTMFGQFEQNYRG